MQPRILLFLAIVVAILLAGCNAATEKDQSSKERSTTGATYNSYQDDIYLEDQGDIEGSGRGTGEVRDDLESSGSGIGPDDEDGDDDFNTGKVEENNPATEPKSPYIEDPITKTPGVEPVNRQNSGSDSTQGEDDHEQDREDNNEVSMNPKHEERASSFFAQPGVLAAVIGGAVVGLLCAILVVMFIVYRMRKKDEGSYALDEPRRSPAAQAYPKPGAPHHNREFYA